MQNTSCSYTLKSSAIISIIKFANRDDYVLFFCKIFCKIHVKLDVVFFKHFKSKITKNDI
jgi:hypothetical protein